MCNAEAVRNNHARYFIALKRSNSANKAVVFAALVAAGITSVEIQFNGESEHRGLSELDPYRNGTLIELPEIEIALEVPSRRHEHSTSKQFRLSEAIECLCYGLLDEVHYGWDADDGAYGRFIFDMAHRTIALEFHKWHFYTTDCTHQF